MKSYRRPQPCVHKGVSSASGMKRIDEVLRTVSLSLELGKGLRRQEVLDRWESVVGAGLSKLSTPDGFEGFELRVSVIHPAALMEFRMRREEILERLNTMAGETIFREIRILAPGRRRG